MSVRVIPASVRKTEGPKEQIFQKPKTRVAAYCRVSTDQEEQESSYEAQIRHYTDFISRNSSLTLAGIYADEGISGTQTRRREQFNAMIADCEADRIDIVITKSISRFARNTLDCLQYIRKLKALGIPILFEKENINTLDSSGEMLITIMASIAQQESQSISQNVRMGIQYRFQQGKPMLQHTWFLGYTKERGGDLEIVPEEADVVRKIYRCFLEGMTIGDIGKQMEAQGIRTGSGKEKWYFSTIVSMLRNEKYMGDLVLQKGYTVDFLTKKKARNNGVLPKYYVENAHEPIVPREIFMQVQREFLRREGVKEATGKTEIHKGNLALNNRIVCSRCGCTYKRIAAPKEENTSWRCRRRLQKGAPCKGRIVKEKDVKAAVVKAMQTLPSRRQELERMRKAIQPGPTAHGAETEVLPDQRAKSDLQSIHIRILLELIDAMEGNDAQEYIPESPACSDPTDFFERTKEIRHSGPVTEFSDDDVRRYIERIEVYPDRMDVIFRGGIVIPVSR